MRVACLGGGPAGLYFAISLKLRQPGAEIASPAPDPPRDGVQFPTGVVEHAGARAEGVEFLGTVADQIGEAHIVDVGTTRTGYGIDPQRDVDMFRFHVSEGQTVAFDIDRPPGSSLDSWIRLLDGEVRLLQHRGLHGVIGSRDQATRVDESKGHFRPARLGFPTVPGDPGEVVHHGHRPPQNHPLFITCTLRR